MLRVLRIIVPNDLGNDEASAVCLYGAGAPPPLPPLISLPLPALERRRVFQHCLNTILSFTN